METLKRPDYQLEFIVNDCRKAIQANPDNPKILEYILTKTRAQDELDRRARLRSIRKDLHGFMFDPLAIDRPATVYQRQNVTTRNRHSYDKDRHRTACFQLAWYKLYDLV